MESEKVKEIKEILESCADDKKPCYKCKYYGKCEKLLDKQDILTLINELERETERLKETVNEMSWQIKVHKYCVGAEHCQNSSIKEQKLKDRIAELEKENEVAYAELSRYTENCVGMLNEKLKQFAERLKVKCVYVYLLGRKVASERIIDETLKEFINGKM